MKKYIAILRGINVGGRNLIRMTDLLSSFEKMGFQQVTTYIQSGNIIFSGSPEKEEKLEHIISKNLKKDFGSDLPVIVLTKEKLENIIEANPFLKDTGKNSAFMHVTFLASTPVPFNNSEIDARKQDGEEYFLTHNSIYFYCPNGYGNTKLTNNFIEQKLQVTATTRNWKTVRKLLEIMINSVEDD